MAEARVANPALQDEMDYVSPLSETSPVCPPHRVHGSPFPTLNMLTRITALPQEIVEVPDR